MTFWINGRLCADGSAEISAADRSFLLGDGCFETLYFDGAELEGVSWHVDSLKRAAEALAIEAPDAKDLRGVLTAARDSLAAAASPAVVRITLSRGAGGRGPDASRSEPLWVVATSPLAQARPFPPLRLQLSSIRRNETSPLSRIKSTSYGDNLAARRAAVKAGFDEALMLNTKGEAACLSMGNVFVLETAGAAPRLRTPSEEAGARPGFMRAEILEAAKSLGIVVDKSCVRLEDIFNAGGVWGVNSLWGFRPVVELDGRKLQTDPTLAEALGQVVRSYRASR